MAFASPQISIAELHRRLEAEFDEKCRIAQWQLRDLRRTFATKLAALRVPPHIIERLLNHKLGTIQTGGEISAVAAIYNRHMY